MSYPTSSTPLARARAEADHLKKDFRSDSHTYSLLAAERLLALPYHKGLGLNELLARRGQVPLGRFLHTIALEYGFSNWDELQRVLVHAVDLEFDVKVYEAGDGEDLTTFGIKAPTRVLAIRYALQQAREEFGDDLYDVEVVTEVERREIEAYLTLWRAASLDEAARSEGWSIVIDPLLVGGISNVTVVFRDYLEASAFVERRASEGSFLHGLALAIVEHRSLLAPPPTRSTDGEGSDRPGRIHDAVHRQLSRDVEYMLSHSGGLCVISRPGNPQFDLISKGKDRCDALDSAAESLVGDEEAIGDAVTAARYRLWMEMGLPEAVVYHSCDESTKRGEVRIPDLTKLEIATALDVVNPREPGDFGEREERARLRAIRAVADGDPCDECGSCGGYHPMSFRGDCRDDNNRLPAAPEDLVGDDLMELAETVGWRPTRGLEDQGEGVIFAAVTDQGTAISESAICWRCAENRVSRSSVLEAAGLPADTPLVDCTGNDQLECQWCGYSNR